MCVFYQTELTFILIRSVTSLEESLWTNDYTFSQTTGSEPKINLSLTTLQMTNLKTRLFDLLESDELDQKDSMVDELDERDIRFLMRKIISNRSLHDSSSLIILIPTTSEEYCSDDLSQNCINSAICIPLSDKPCNKNPSSCECKYKTLFLLKPNKKNYKKI